MKVNIPVNLPLPSLRKPPPPAPVRALNVVKATAAAHKPAVAATLSVGGLILAATIAVKRQGEP